MTHQISLPEDTYFMLLYLTAVMVLIGVLLLAVYVRDIARNTPR
jgi:hypothetical protein